MKNKIIILVYLLLYSYGYAQEAPVFTSANTVNVAENGTTVMTLTATDADSSNEVLNFDIIGNESGNDILSSGMVMVADDSRVSPDGLGTLLMQSDGNLVLYGFGGAINWASNTIGNPGAVATLETNGNLIIGLPGEAPLFSTNSETIDGSTPQLRVLNDGQIVIERGSDGQLVWESILGNTQGGGVVEAPSPSTYDNDKFEIINGNELVFKVAPDFENPTDINGDNVYVVRVKVTDETGLFAEQDITVTVTNLLDVDPTTTFNSVWRTTETDEFVTIPTLFSETYNGTIEWGDGTVEDFASPALSHVYENPGDYTVRISGIFPRILFDSSGDRLKIQAVTQWGNIAWSSMDRAFNGAFNVEVTATDIPDLSNVSSTRLMFGRCNSLQGNATFNTWDVSNVNDMASMFAEASQFNQPLDNWDVSNVTTMQAMFFDATAFDQDLGSWDISSLQNASFMFSNDPGQSLPALSTANYDSLLNGWSTLDAGETSVPSNIEFDAGDSQFCLGEPGRSVLEALGWTITDGGRNPLCVDTATAFTTIWRTTTANESITIPTTGSGYDYIVDWGDGTIEGNQTGNATHTYVASGDHTVRISGSFPCIFFNGQGDRQKILAVIQWGNIVWNSMESAFRGAFNMDVTATDAPDLSNVSSLLFMFDTCTSLTGTSAFNTWDTSNVTTMGGMFRNDTAFNQPIGDWNTENVTNMGEMFFRAEFFDQPIGTWNTGNVTNMGTMFREARNFNQAIGSWDVSKVIGMNEMFFSATSFNQDIGAWDTASATTMSQMFQNTPAFNQDIGGWDTASVTNMVGMFEGAETFNQDLGLWDISSLATATAMFNGATLSLANYDSLLNGWVSTTIGSGTVPSGVGFSGGNSQFCHGETARQNLIDNFNWFIEDSGRSPLCVDTTTAFTTLWRTTTANESITIPTTGSGYDYIVDWGDGTVEGNQTGNASHTYATPGDHTVRISGNFPRIFFNEQGDRLKIREVMQWGDIIWSSMENAFSGAINMDVTAIDAPDLSGVSSLFYMFNSCNNMIGTPAFNTWNTSNVTTMGGMFRFATLFNQPIGNWNTSSVTNMNLMFAGATAFAQPIGDWNTTMVNDMGSMFLSARNFNQPIGAWNTTNVNDMSQMFFDAILFNQDIGGWNTVMVMDMFNMFRDAVSFNQPIGSWNTGNVNNMFGMFRGATSFNQNIENWNTANVTSMSRMFQASSFDQDLGSWDITSLTTASNMFNAVTLSTANYDSLLNGWSSTTIGSGTVPSNVSFHGGFSQYCEGEAARVSLQDVGWNFIDGGQEPLCGIANTDFFITIWRTSLPNEDITIPTIGGGYDYIIDWGDGTIETNQTGDATHTYATPGDYSVRIAGSFPRIFFNGQGDREKILAVSQWGNIVWNSMEHAFSGATNMDVTASDAPDLSNVSSLLDMFNQCFNLVGTPAFNTWNTGNVTIMDGMFRHADAFNQPIGNWNTSNVVNMSEMFRNADAFNQPLGNWNTSNVMLMFRMFRFTRAFDQPIGNWDTANVSIMTQMFHGATSFDQDLGAWDISSLTDARGMFNVGAKLSIANYDSLLNGWASTTIGTGTVPSNVRFDADDSQFCLGEDARQNLIDNFNWTIFDGNQYPLCGVPETDFFVTIWRTTTNDEIITIPTFSGETYNYTVDWGDGVIEMNHTGDATHTYAMAGDYTVRIVGVFPRIFFNAGGDREKIRAITQWGTNIWSSMENAFQGAFNMDVNATDVPNLSNVNSLLFMFADCNSLIGTPIFNTWDTSNVTNMGAMFLNAAAFNQPIGNWNIENATNLGQMFDSAIAFNQPIGSWNTGNVTNMGQMFRNATAFNQPIGSWNTAMVSSMFLMFSNSSNFNQDIGDWSTGLVFDMDSMFSNATAFDQDLGAWNISSLLGASDIFNEVTLSIANYDSLLIGWSTLDPGETQIPEDIDFGGGNSRYCNGANARANLIGTHGWNVTDGGQDAGCGTCTETVTYTAGGWVPNAPTANSSVIISSEYNTGIVGASIDACEITVDAGVTLTIAAGDYLNVQGNITVNGSLIAEHQGSVVQISPTATVTNNGTINVNVTTPELEGRDFMLMGSPMTAENRTGVWNTAGVVRNHITANFVPNPDVTTQFPTAENFADDNLNNWLNYAGGLNAGEGYFVRPQPTNNEAAATYDFTYQQGTLNNGNIDFTVVYNGTQNGSPNVMANPYASPISATEFMSENGIDALYYWEHVQQPSTTLPGANNMNFSMEDISMINSMGIGMAAASDATTTPNNSISTAQGFAFKASQAGTATFTNAMRRTSGNNTLRGQEAEALDKLQLTVKSVVYESGGSAVIAFSEVTTADWDPGADNDRLATIVSLYSHLDDGREEFGIQMRETFDDEITILMGFSTLIEESTSYKVSITNLEGLNLPGATVFLKDNYNGTITNLTETAYEFTSNMGTFNERFTLQFRSEDILSTEDQHIEALEIGLYPNPTSDVINLEVPRNIELQSVTIYDLMGRVVKRMDFSVGNSEKKINVQNLAAASYIVMINTNNGQITKRMIKR